MREITRSYQPIYLRGEVDPRYEYQRECEDRYQPIKALASRFNRPFSVLDIGGNYGYFDYRLMEDFDCCCVIIDNKNVDNIIEHNGFSDRCAWIDERHPAYVYEALSVCEHFDIVLALAVLHHMDDPGKAKKAFHQLGTYSIFEIPGERDILAANPERHAEIRKLFSAMEPVATFQSHVSDTVRPMYICQSAPVLEYQTIDALDRSAPNYATYEIESDFDSSRIRIDRQKGQIEERDFIPGMNLYNAQRLGLRFPGTEAVLDAMLEHPEHPDLKPWNFILGRGIKAIDWEPPCGP